MRVGVLILCLSLSVAFSESFEEFKRSEFEGFKSEEKAFEVYKRSVEKEFEEFKRIVMEEFEAYKREVIKHWGFFEGTDRKKIVDYSQDWRVKRVVDFDKGEIRIEAVGKDVSWDELYKEFEKLSKATVREFYERDRLAKRVEKKVSKMRNVVRSKDIPKDPVVAPLIVGKDRYTEGQLKDAVKRLLSGADRYEKSARGKNIKGIRIKLPPKNLLVKAKKYKPVVVRESRRWKVDHPLVFAVIHTESSFNPLATSPVPAYGLMQIVPTTAGKDASKVLFGKPKILSPSFLYNPENNIKVGTVYIHLLYYRYFKDVKNPLSRLYCTIAAYNTGPGNVAYAFTGTRNLKRAIRVINSMSPQEVYDTLMRNLPYDETKDYLKKVTARVTLYENI